MIIVHNNFDIVTTKLLLLNFVNNIADETFWSRTRNNIYFIIYVFVYLFGFVGGGYMVGDYTPSYSIVNYYTAGYYTAGNHIAVGDTAGGYKAEKWVKDFQNLVKMLQYRLCKDGIRYKDK